MERSLTVATDPRPAALLAEAIARGLGADPVLAELAGPGHAGLDWGALPPAWLRSGEAGAFLCHQVSPPSGPMPREGWSLRVTAFWRGVPDDVADAMLFQAAVALGAARWHLPGQVVRCGPLRREGLTVSGAGLRRADLCCQIRS